jgi:hypothetical protein
MLFLSLVSLDSFGIPSHLSTIPLSLYFISMSSWAPYSFHYSKITIFSFLVVLGFEFRASWLLGKLSNTWTMTPALFPLFIFEIGFCFLPRLPEPWFYYFKRPSTVGMTGTCHHTQLLLVKMGSLEFFAWAGLEHLSSWFQPRVATIACKFFCCCFCVTGVWTQGLHLELLHQSFFVVGFLR